MHAYIKSSLLLLSIVAIFHILRVLLDWKMVLNGYVIPQSLSIAVAVLLVIFIIFGRKRLKAGN